VTHRIVARRQVFELTLCTLRWQSAAAHTVALRHPEGMREISRGLSAASAATPPETGSPNLPTLKGSHNLRG